MKSIVCERPHEFRLREVSEPVFKQGEALIQVCRIGICGTDIHAFHGNQPYFEYPRVLGHELSGVIVQVGENVYGLQKGDQVTIIPYLQCGTCIACRNGKTNCCTNMKVLGVHVDGGMCELISVPVDQLVKTDELSLDQSAIVEPLAIGAHAIRRSNAQSGETTLVIGAGPIGLGVAAFAKLQGSTVFVMDINEERLSFCAKWAGVDSTINVFDNPTDALSALTNGDFPTIVYDATGNAQSMMNAFKYVAHGGTLVYVGLNKEDITFSDPEFHKKELTLMSSRNSTHEDFRAVIRAMREGRIDAKTYVTHRSHFDELIAKFEGLIRPESGVIKAIIEV